MTPETAKLVDTGQPRGRPGSPRRRGLDRRGDRRGAVGQAGALRAAGARSPAGQRRLLQHVDHPLALFDKDAAREPSRRDFLITHFFNPPRFMRLLEVVAGPATRPEDVGGDHPSSPISASARAWCGRRTPRASSPTGSAPTGCRRRSTRRSSWGLTVEEADAVLGRPGGHSQDRRVRAARSGRHRLDPKVASSRIGCCRRATGGAPTAPAAPDPSDDRGGLTGRKGKGGFYRLSR